MTLSGIKDWLKLCNQTGLLSGTILSIRLNTGKLDDLRVAGMPTTFSLRAGTSDIATFYQIFVGREFEFALPFEPRSIIDGGANIGLATLFLKSKFPDARIVCIEPDRENFEILKKNVGKLNDVILLEGGLWHTKSSLSISDKYEMGKWAMVVEENNDASNNKTLIETYTVDEVMKLAGLDQIDLLKLDIETAERELFGKNFQTWLPKTKAIVIELHDWMSKGCSKPFFKAINETFNSYSYGSKGENTIIVNEDLL
jgi:FkbM family methyltransferase